MDNSSDGKLKNTKLVHVDPANPERDLAVIDEAASVIERGGVVAFPTETVYGLGANALDPQAAMKIYEAKGRPRDNPLIVHIADVDGLTGLVESVPEAARILMEEFWPGPLTIIFKKAPGVPSEISGGLDTIAVRLPSDKIARLLIKRAGLPIAAPSANSSGKPSPTRASHVEFDLGGKIDMIIDGGSSEYGLESTIIDVTSVPPCLLRPGSISVESLNRILGPIAVDLAVTGAPEQGLAPKAPGMKYTHYSPLADITIIDGPPFEAARQINRLAADSHRKIGILATEQTRSCYDADKFCVLVMGSREQPETIGANLYKMLRKFDFYGVEEVLSESVGEGELGLAIMNRLKKAAGYKIIKW